MTIRNTATLSGELYDAIIQAFEDLASLFEGDEMPDPLFTVTDRKGAHGYFVHGRWAGQGDYEGDAVSEICLCALSLHRPPRDVLGTLLHEMVHHWQQHNGEPGKKGYHNQQWAEKMLDVGLRPVSLDQPGTMTGRKVTHEIIEDWVGAVVIDRLVAEGWHLPVKGLPVAAKKTGGSPKVCYVCPVTGVKAWGKPGLRLICEDSDERMIEQGGETDGGDDA